MKIQWKQYSCALIAALLWGTAFVAQDLCAGKIGAFTFNGLRSMIGVIFLGIFLLIRAAARKKVGYPVEKRNMKDLLLGGFLSGLFLFGASNLQQFGISDSGGGKAAFITTLYIVLVPIFGLFLKKKPPVTIWGAVVIAAAGLYFLSIKEDFTIATGDLFLMACAVMFTLQILVLDHFAQKVDGIELSFVQFITMSWLSCFCAMFEHPDAGAILSCALPVLYVGIFSCGIAYTLQIISQKGTNPTIVSLLFSLEAVFGLAATTLLLKTFPTPREWIGSALLLGAVVLAQLPAPQGKKKK